MRFEGKIFLESRVPCWCNEACPPFPQSQQIPTALLRCPLRINLNVAIRHVWFTKETDGQYQIWHKLGPSLPRLLSCHKIERKMQVGKVTYLLLCVKRQTPIPVLFVNLLMDFDASVPIDHYRAHIGSWKFVVNNIQLIGP